MRQQDITSAQIIGRIGETASHDAAPVLAMSLMRAVPFTLKDETDFHLSSVELGCQVLKSHSEGLPQTLKSLTARMSADDIRARQQAIARLSWDGAQYCERYDWRTAQGDVITLEERGIRISGEAGRARLIHGVLRNVTQAQRQAEKQANLAIYDELTGLLNQSAFERALQQLMALCARQRLPGALLRIRLTNLDDINSVYGYDMGDRFLALVAGRLGQALRAPDEIARLEDGDFAVTVYGADAAAIELLCERLEAELGKAPFLTPYGALYGEFALSAAAFGPSAQALPQSPLEALEQTEIAMQSATKTPSGSPAWYTPALGSACSAPAETTEEDILGALNQRRITLAYQPIIHAQSRELHHYECLLRLRRDDGELMSAGRFIMAAERLGLVQLLDRRAMELAAETLIADPNIKLALNVSAATIKTESGMSEYLAALRGLGAAASRVTIELTETVALDDPAMASQFSNEIRKLGCEFAIDDFGSGYTTFRNLMAIEADTIKIDGSFIEDIATQPHKQTFVRMMVDLAQTFSVGTVAEMVDSRADAEMLRRLGVDYLQGYMFGVPAAVPSWQKQAS